jgi:hypothetical protein
MQWAIPIYKFFTSLRCAVTLIILLAIVFSVGTFLESYYGTDAARLLVYDTTWFSFLLILLALNLLASAVDRMPWKRKHVGFLTTHLGIILILFGSVVTKLFAVEGQLVIEEGKIGTRMMLKDPLVRIAPVGFGKEWGFPVKARPFAWSGEEELIPNMTAPFRIRVLKNYPKARPTEKIVESESGGPALHVALKGSMAEVDQWLLLDDPDRSQAPLGPATIRFTDEPIKKPKKEEVSEWGSLIFNFESGAAVTIRLDRTSRGKVFPLEGTRYDVRIQEVFRDAAVVNNTLIDQSDQWRNPAVKIWLEGDNFSEQHTVFTHFPEFPTVHGLGPSEARVRIAYELESMPGAVGGNELRLIHKAGGLPNFQVKRGDQIREGRVKLGEEIETGWMDFKFTVDHYHEKAKLKQEFLKLPSSSMHVEALPVIEIEIEKGSEIQRSWLPQGEVQVLPIGGSDYHVVYSVETRPMGYQLLLRDFIIETNPGTNQPAAFKSEVTLKDVSRGIDREVLIQMNEPLKHRGYKIYQSGYIQEPNQPEISIFSVARDPGNLLKYAGTIIMVSGIVMLFYVRSLSTLKTFDPKLRKVR